MPSDSEPFAGLCDSAQRSIILSFRLEKGPSPSLIQSGLLSKQFLQAGEGIYTLGRNPDPPASGLSLADATKSN
jgi:hypothetical protein